MITPLRWHLYIIDLEPRIGTKPGKQRPCICIQPSEFCAAGHGSAIVVPLTAKTISEDIFPLRVKIPKGTCGLDRESDALIDQMLAWDRLSFIKDLGEIPEGLQEILKRAIRDFLNL